MTNEDFEHLEKLIWQSHRLLFAGRVTGKLQMLRDLSLEMVLLLQEKGEKDNERQR